MTAIEFENISKQYRLGLVSTNTLSHDLKRWYAMNIQGKDDPYLKIGEVNDRAHRGESEYVWALKDINFKVEQGDVLGIIGKNGAGKSTLLKILSKVTTPSTGTIKARGRIASLLEVGTGFHPEMTGRENIYMNGAIMGMTKAEITRRFDEIVDFSGVERYIDTPAKRYSSGMTVRLGFAIAAHLEPEILVVDEVLAVGDAEFQKKAIGKMQDVSKGEGRTVLFVSHNMTAVKNLCNNGIILENGSIAFSGSINNVINKYILNQESRSNLSLSTINDREGNGFLRVMDVCFLDSENRNKNTFNVGETLKIMICFKAKEVFYENPESRIDIGFNDLLGNRVMWLSTGIFKNRISEKDKVIFEISEILLMEGVYNLNISCSSNGIAIDSLKNIMQLTVLFNDYYKTGRSIPTNQGNLVPKFEIL